MLLGPDYDIREIPGCPGYDADTLGSIYSRKRGERRKLRQFDRMLLSGRPSGYMSVSIRRDGHKRNQYVHDLVLTTFRGPRPSLLHEACHGPDRTRSNNALANLRWDSIAANTLDRIHDCHEAGREGHAFSDLL